MLLKAIILHCQKQLNNERSINSIYHLLAGKQSIQTIQDAYLFRLVRYYSLYKQLSKKQFAEQIIYLKQNGYIKRKNDESFTITNKGKQWLENVKLHEFHWHGMKFNKMDTTFFRRLLLFIQVWTNSKNHHHRYIPIVDDEATFHWIKTFYQKEKEQISTRLKQLNDELVDILSHLPSIYPHLFVDQITTAKSIGLTYEQLAIKYEKSVTDIYLLQMNYVHYLLQTVLNKQLQYPLLYLFIKDMNENKQLKTVTKSANITLSYVQQGLTPRQIASRRQLKINTIYDHIVEIALNDDDFPLDKFVPQNKQEEIFAAVRKLNSLKLKKIKNSISENITYFQIRLALTKINKLYGE